jgi:hypothetical protein
VTGSRGDRLDLEDALLRVEDLARKVVETDATTTPELDQAISNLADGIDALVKLRQRICDRQAAGS